VTLNAECGVDDYSAACFVFGCYAQVHEGQDDLGLGNDEGSRTTGNAGPRYGCCIITETTGNIMIYLKM